MTEPAVDVVAQDQQEDFEEHVEHIAKVDKNRRGRPRKCKEITQQNVIKDDAATCTDQDGIRKEKSRNSDSQDVTCVDGNQTPLEVAASSAKNHQAIEQGFGVKKKRGRPQKQNVTSGNDNILLPEVTAGTKTKQKVERGCKATKKRVRPRKCKQIMKTDHDIKICQDKEDTRGGSKEGFETLNQSYEVTNSRANPLPEVAGSSEKLNQVLKVNKKRGRPRKHKQSTTTAGDVIIHPDADGSNRDCYNKGSEVVSQCYEGTKKDHNMLDCSVVAENIFFEKSTPEGLMDVSANSPPLMSPMATPVLSTTNDAHLPVKTSSVDTEKGVKNLQTNGRKRRRASFTQKRLEAAELEVAQKRSKMNPGCICQYCKKSFSSVVSSLRHENLHTGYKPYKCDACFEAFSNGTYLKRHTDKVHGSIGVKKEPKLRKDRDSKSGPKPVVAIGEDDTCTNGGFSSDHLNDKQKNASSTVTADDDRITNVDITEKSSHPQNTVKGKDNSTCLQEGDISLKAQKSRRGRPRKLQKKSSISIGGTSSVLQQAVESSMAPVSLSTTGDVIVTRSKVQNQLGEKTTALAQKKLLVAEKQQVNSSIASLSTSTPGTDVRVTRSKEQHLSSGQTATLAQTKLVEAEKQQNDSSKASASSSTGGDVKLTKSKEGKHSSVETSALAQKQAVEEKQQMESTMASDSSSTNGGEVSVIISKEWKQSSVKAPALAQRELQIGEKQQRFDHTYTRLRPGKLQGVSNNLKNEAVVQKQRALPTSRCIGSTMEPLENSKEYGTHQTEDSMATKKAEKRRRSTSSRHTCQYCKKIFYSSSNRTRHERLHTGIKPYKCMQCAETFSNGEYLKRHVKRIHEKYNVRKQNGKPKRDQETGAKCATITEPITNATTRNGEPSLKILKESKRKTTKQVADTKKGKKPKKSISSSRTCQYCKKVFYSSYTRIRHERLHIGIKPFKCMQCAQAFSSEEHLKWHVKRFHEACSVKRQVRKQNGKPEKEQESDVKNGNALKDLKGVDASMGSEQRCICQFCKKVFSNFAVHKRHERLHTGQKLYKCKWCAEAFANGIYLPRHVGEVHDGADEKSKEPKRMTKTDGPTMKPLENSNKDDTNIVVSMYTKKQKKLKRDTSSSRTCQYCKKVFYSSWSRIRHERLHTGIMPYKCMQCTKAFSNGEYLKWHMKRFHEACNVKKQSGKPQKDQETGKGRGSALKNLNGVDASMGSKQRCICQFCKKVFSKIGNCRRHERLHTGQKPYKCKMCAEAFANGTYLQLHVGKVHKGVDEKSTEGKQKKKTQKKEKKRVRFDLVSGQKSKGKDVNPEKTASTISQDVKPKCNSKLSKIISKQKQHKNQDTKDVQPQVESERNVSKQKHHQRPGVCHFCKKVFTRVEYCMEHENSIHMGLKPYKCLLCGAAFGLSSSLYKHKKKCVGDGTIWTVSRLKDTQLSLKKVSDVCKTSSTLRKVGEEKTPSGFSQQTHQNFQQKESSTHGKKNKTNKGLVLAASSRKQNQDKILKKKSQLKIKKEHCNKMSSLPKVNQNGEPSSHQNDLTAQHTIVSSVHPAKDAKMSTNIVKKCSKREKLHSQGGKQSTASKTIPPVAKSSHTKCKSCSYCGKFFPGNRALIHEKAVHLRLKLYQCPWCDKKYSWPYDLNKHKKTHAECNGNPVTKQEKENYNERREKGQIQPKAIDSGVQARSGTDKETTTTDMPARRVKEAGKARTKNSSSSEHGSLTRRVKEAGNAKTKNSASSEHGSLTRRVKEAGKAKTKNSSSVGHGALTRVAQTQSSPVLSANHNNSRAGNMLNCFGQVQKSEQTSSAQYESSCESHVDDNFDVENWFEDENNNVDDDVSQTTEKDSFQITNISNYASVCQEEMNESATGMVNNMSVPVLRSNTTKSLPATLMSNLENDDSSVNKDEVASATPSRVNDKGLCDVASLDDTESIEVERGSVPKHNHTDSSESTAEIIDQDCSGTNYVVQVNLSQKYSVVIMCEPSAETKTLVGRGEDKQDKGSNKMAQNNELATFTSDESGEEMPSETGETIAVQSEEDRDIIMLEAEKQPSTSLTPPWTCEVCGVVFDSRIPFVYHQRIHDGDGVMNGRAALWTMPEGVYSEFYCSPEGLYKCSFCSSVFTQERQLKSHNFIHARNIDKPFGCPQCGGQYHLFKDWVTHMECHRSHKYLCKHCNRSFNVVKNWWRHELSHPETVE